MSSDWITANYANYYDQDADLPEWRRLGALDKCANIVHLCSEIEHNKLLEIGCGDGALIEHLAELRFGKYWSGLEISPSAVRSCEAKRIPNCQVRLFDGYKIPDGSMSFDLAILSHVLEHVEHPRALVYEAARVAKHIFIEVPLEDTWRLSHEFFFDRVGHINFYSYRTARRLVQSCRMKILGERLSHSGRASYVYRKGRLKGTLSYWVKQAGILSFPAFISQAVTYNYSALCTQVEI